MEIIGVGEEILQSLKNSNALLDARLDRLTIFEESSKVIGQLVFTPRSGTFPDRIMLVLYDVVEFYFSYEQPLTFYDVVRYKLFRTVNDLFYLSIDPEDEGEMMSTGDNGVITSHGISVYLLSHNQVDPMGQC